jgi:hypothetical protein
VKTILFLSLSLIPAVWADQVVLKNGDTITGSIVKKDGAKLTIKSEFLGEVSMPWSAVKTVTSDAALHVVLPSGETAVGKITTTGENLDVATPAGAKSAPLAGVTNIRNDAEQHTFDRMLHPGLGQLWTGSLDMGLALARGNARTETFNTAFAASRVTRHDKITVMFNEIYAQALVNNVNSTTASSVRTGWTYNHDLTPRFFLSTLNTYEHDHFQNLALRFVAGGGAGINAVKTDRTSLSFNAGGDYMRENFTDTSNRNSGELNFGDDFLYKLSASTNVTQSWRFFPNLTFTGEYRTNFDMSAVTAIKKWLGFHISASDHFVSNPVLGHQKNDLILSTGLRLTFAR